MHKFDIAATTFLFIAFFIEFTLILFHKPEKKMLKDIKANFLLGLCIILVGLFEKGFSFSVFSLCYQFAFFTPPLSWWWWAVGFLSCDFIHYFYHWLGHKTQLFWTAHVTHHSSQYFNLSTGLRTNFLHLFYRFLFWAPLCFIGIPPAMILFFESITAILNFLVHTEKIGKLPILDWIFNTPSNHRVHHGSNAGYIDKNLGGILMIYDHLLGTYAKETVAPVYGITHNIETNNPIKILLHEFIKVIRELHKIKGMASKFSYLFSRPQ